VTDTTTQPATQAAPPADWWRDPSRLTEADKEFLGRMQDREAEALDVTSDEHEYVWGFRQDRPNERHRLNVADATANKDNWHRKLAVTGHDMRWRPADHDQAGMLPTWHGTCVNCGATISVEPSGTTAGGIGRFARTDPCAGPGTAWQNDLIEERQGGRFRDAVSRFGQEVKEQHDKAWLRDQGIEES
jgi:hypothetical protein